MGGETTISTMRSVVLSVYPRVGGETIPRVEPSDTTTGLSPRGRGNPGLMAGYLCDLWSIPAWAGKPSAAASDGRIHQVYPRVGGETACARLTKRAVHGLSPRGRGNL